MVRKLKDITDKKVPVENFITQYLELQRLEQNSNKRFVLSHQYFYPCLNDNTKQTQFDRHYVYHPAWAAGILSKTRPSKHIDIASSLHFCSILAAFITVDFYDYRPANLKLDNLRSLSADLMRLPFADSSVESISCMHTIEHVGLGRYGDPIDYDGDLKAIKELKRVLAPGGTLLFVVPLGAKDLICFNAHRIYSKGQILQLFDDLILKEFTLIPENPLDGGLVKDPNDALLEKQYYGCGCFWFSKT